MTNGFLYFVSVVPFGGDESLAMPATIFATKALSSEKNGKKISKNEKRLLDSITKLYDHLSVF